MAEKPWTPAEDADVRLEALSFARAVNGIAFREKVVGIDQAGREVAEAFYRFVAAGDNAIGKNMEAMHRKAHLEDEGLPCSS